MPGRTGYPVTWRPTPSTRPAYSPCAPKTAGPVPRVRVGLSTNWAPADGGDVEKEVFAWRGARLEVRKRRSARVGMRRPSGVGVGYRGSSSRGEEPDEAAFGAGSVFLLAPAPR